MYTLCEKGNTDSFSKKNYQDFSDIDALTVLMFESFLRSYGYTEHPNIPSFSVEKVSTASKRNIPGDTHLCSLIFISVA